MRAGRGGRRLGMILWAGKYPFAESWECACYCCDSDVAENFPPFHSLPAHLPSLTETAF
jgi:hypothetical protein